MDEVQWIKLYVSVVSDPKITFIRGLPEGDTVALIWLMLIAIAGRCNAGGMLMVTADVPYDSEGLAGELGVKPKTMSFALQTFEKLHMLETVNGCWYLPNWDKYQSEDRLNVIREKNRLRQQRHRARLSSTSSGALPDGMSQLPSQLPSRYDNRDVSRYGNVICNGCNATEEERENREKEISFIHSASGDEKNDGIDEEDEERKSNELAKMREVCGRSRRVLLSDEQMEDLLSRMSMAEFNRYFAIVDENEMRGHHYTRKTHYVAILEMAEKDRKIYGERKPV